MFTVPTLFSAAIGIVVLGLIVALVHLLRNPSLPYPPGPPKHLIWGNYKDVQCAKPWYRFTTWKRNYGDLVHVSVLGQHNIIINSLDVAEELLNKRSVIYSDRPQIPLVKLTGWDVNLGLLPYGVKWRAHRRLFEQAFNAKTTSTYRPLQTEKMYSFLNDVLDTPEDLMQHTHRLIASMVMKIVYGHDISKDGPDRLLDATELALDAFADLMLPGAWLVNSLPFLQYLPSWLPGCRAFNEFARNTKSLINIMAVESYHNAKERSQDKFCLVTALENTELSSGDASPPYTEDVYISVCGTAYAAAAETTTGSLGVFFLMMCQHPEIQLKAYKEIMRVTGAQRLPMYEDRTSLPYVEAIFREVMRWMPVAPLAGPHSTTREDVFRGHYIPKGCIMIPNVWAMCNDESKYPDPRRFFPERFLTPEGTINDDDTVLTFGLGRRVCPGRYFADAIAWWTIAVLLAGFELSISKDDELAGQQLTDGQIEDMFTEGVVVHAKPFRCCASPRSQKVVNMIRNLDI